MGYSFVYKKAAEKYLDKQAAYVKRKILLAVAGLPGGDVRKMKGREGYRLVVGDFRVLLEETDKRDEDGNIIIIIKSIGPRGDVYKK